MGRRWTWVLAFLLVGWALAVSCTLDLGPVLDPKDAGSDTTGDSTNVTDTGNPDVYVLPAGCLNATIVEAQCDPFSNAGCYGGYGCDTTFYTQPRLACLPNDGLVLGDECNLATGPYCAGTFTCTGSPGVCANFCCTDSECPGGVCIPFDINLGTLGFCSINGDGGFGDGSP